ncbi:hypothetical protein WN51_05948 [Melipona quadrifasciata]|uniref:Uncharacterized protein n=1 Tax=Melipona quadrifasciata TaxID=166423 RepID=A0A0M9A672_9HYME|nr:hypothetical protein WN51_05948 [Melipona quadrifasciata]
MAETVQLLGKQRRLNETSEEKKLEETKLWSETKKRGDDDPVSNPGWHGSSPSFCQVAAASGGRSEKMGRNAQAGEKRERASPRGPGGRRGGEKKHEEECFSHDYTHYQRMQLVNETSVSMVEWAGTVESPSSHPELVGALEKGAEVERSPGVSLRETDSSWHNECLTTGIQ